MGIRLMEDAVRRARGWGRGGGGGREALACVGTGENTEGEEEGGADGGTTKDVRRRMRTVTSTTIRTKTYIGRQKCCVCVAKERLFDLFLHSIWAELPMTLSSGLSRFSTSRYRFFTVLCYAFFSSFFFAAYLV